MYARGAMLVSVPAEIDIGGGVRDTLWGATWRSDLRQRPQKREGVTWQASRDLLICTSRTRLIWVLDGDHAGAQRRWGSRSPVREAADRRKKSYWGSVTRWRSATRKHSSTKNSEGDPKRLKKSSGRRGQTKRVRLDYALQLKRQNTETSMWKKEITMAVPVRRQRLGPRYRPVGKHWKEYRGFARRSPVAYHNVNGSNDNEYASGGPIAASKKTRGESRNQKKNVKKASARFVVTMPDRCQRLAPRSRRNAKQKQSEFEATGKRSMAADTHRCRFKGCP